ncbi:MAG TPA: phosphate ABC transporter substrate-binding protein PstS [Streptosporangiaceae bacterium]|nr:phosphate ABC transporter substrate-binding protein PstS [Streptosporangiaceae bacterium]
MAIRFRAPIAAVGLIPVALLAAACGGGSSAPKSSASPSASHTASASAAAAVPAAPAPSPESLSETGSTLLYPLFNLWVPAYEKQYHQVRITTAGTGSGTGISQAAAGAVQIGASDAYLSSTDRSKYPGLMNIPLAISAQQINYNIPGLSQSTHLKLNGSVLSQIYQGKITNWDAPAIRSLNPGVPLPSMKIVPLHRADGSGDTFLFTTYLSDQDRSGWGTKVGYGTTVSWPSVPGALAEEGNGGMVSGCKATAGCVAYIGISYLKKTTAAGLGEAQLKNASGTYLLPTSSTIPAEAASFVSKTPANESLSLINGPAAGGYPIINYEYAIVNTKQSSAAVAQDVKAFLHWALTTGNSPAYLSQVQFQPLPSSVVTLSDAQIAKITG